MIGWTDLPADLSDTAALARLNAHLPARPPSSRPTSSAPSPPPMRLQPAGPACPTTPPCARSTSAQWEAPPFAEIEAEDPDPHPRLLGEPRRHPRPRRRKLERPDHPRPGRARPSAAAPHPTSSSSPISARSCRAAARHRPDRATEVFAQQDRQPLGHLPHPRPAMAGPVDQSPSVMPHRHNSSFPFTPRARA